MKKKYLYISIFSLAAFVLWTLLLCFVDVRAIGPEGSSVGFSALNGFIHEKIGVNMYLYNITDWLGLVPIGVALGFAILGLIQLIKRKSLLRVDRSILALGVFYIIVVAVYLFFEIVVINYRPVLIEGCLEASYPSSTTMLVTCVMPSAAMQAKERVNFIMETYGSSILRTCLYCVLALALYICIALCMPEILSFINTQLGNFKL